MPNTFHEYFISRSALPVHNVEYEKGCLNFHGVPLIPLVKKYGTPLRMYYLPNISQKIRDARVMFKEAMKS